MKMLLNIMSLPIILICVGTSVGNYLYHLYLTSNIMILNMLLIYFIDTSHIQFV